MNKKLYTILFILITTVINVLLTVLIIAALIAGALSVMKFGMKLPADHSSYGTVLLLCFVAGMIISFFVYTKLSTKIILKFGMDKKFEDKWFSKGSKSSADGKTEEVKKTNMPSSVLPSEEEQEVEDKWGN